MYRLLNRSCRCSKIFHIGDRLFTHNIIPIYLPIQHMFKCILFFLMHLHFVLHFGVRVICFVLLLASCIVCFMSSSSCESESTFLTTSEVSPASYYHHTITRICSSKTKAKKCLEIFNLVISENAKFAECKECKD